MVLIFGGVYQGKLDYVKERFDADDVYYCKDDCTQMPTGSIIYEIDKWILALIKADMAPNMPQFLKENPDEVVICNDIGGGVVPMDAMCRKWREEVGRGMGYLARHSDEVIRLFCGIPTRVK